MPKHSNRSSKGVMAPDVHIHDDFMEVDSQKNEFLRNTANKRQLIKRLSIKFREAQIVVWGSKGYTGTPITKTAKSCIGHGSVVVV